MYGDDVQALCCLTGPAAEYPGLSSVLDINERGFTAQSAAADLLRLDVCLLKSKD